MNVKSKKGKKQVNSAINVLSTEEINKKIKKLFHVRVYHTIMINFIENIISRFESCSSRKSAFL